MTISLVFSDKVSIIYRIAWASKELMLIPGNGKWLLLGIPYATNGLLETINILFRSSVNNIVQWCAQSLTSDNVPWSSSCLCYPNSHKMFVFNRFNSKRSNTDTERDTFSTLLERGRVQRGA